ncbi:hypothetical protein [Roseomonas sp. AR75]|uniref:cell division protein FtsL n=1 Tax=Roseomonas sp. AR75 TaxID=2562311 RepID=UPI0010C01CEA|nr:hypothetical protein [Roseomonas sp. AR75]
MIRPFTLLCFFAFAGAGAWLYQIKHAVAVKDRELTEIRRQTEQARQRIDILRAEWALLNEPDRLRQTATQVLALEPMQPQHFVRLTDVGRRLPNAVAFAGAPDLFAPASSSAPATMLASAPASRPAAPGTAPAAAQDETPAPQALVATLAAQRAEQASRIAQASAPRPPRPQRPAQPVVRPAVHIAPAAPQPEPPPTRIAAQQTATVASTLGTASSLGRPMLAPPVPIAPAAAATLHGREGPVASR